MTFNPINRGILFARVQESLNRSNVSMTPEASESLVKACRLFEEIETEYRETPNAKSVAASQRTLDSMIADWQWRGANTVALHFWNEVFKVIKPLGETALKIAIQAAINGALQKL